MAALTLFQNPHMQPEGYSIDYSAYSAPATVIQRRQRRRIGAVNRIAAGMRGFLTRRRHIAFAIYDRFSRRVVGLHSNMREHLMQTMFTYPYGRSLGNNPYALTPLLRRRDNMLEARSNYRSASRNRTFGNIPLGMQ